MSDTLKRVFSYCVLVISCHLESCKLVHLRSSDLESSPTFVAFMVNWSLILGLRYSEEVLSGPPLGS